MMSGGQGFDFNYAVAGIAQTPLPASWTMMLSGLGAVYLLGWIRKRKAAAIWSKHLIEFRRHLREAVLSVCADQFANVRFWHLADIN
jgi:PEP-CTERM motif